MCGLDVVLCPPRSHIQVILGGLFLGLSCAEVAFPGSSRTQGICQRHLDIYISHPPFGTGLRAAVPQPDIVLLLDRLASRKSELSLDIHLDRPSWISLQHRRPSRIECTRLVCLTQSQAEDC
jgi:hypothetical protein